MPMGCEGRSRAPNRTGKQEEDWQATLRLPRSAADMFADADEAEGLTWALVSILEPSTDAGLQASYVKGALEVAYCAVHRLERLRKDIAQLSDEEQVQMRAHLRTRGAA